MDLPARFAAALAALLTVALPPVAAAADAPVLRIVGGAAGTYQYERFEQPFWTRELPRLTGGRARAEIVPFDQAGIRGQEMLRLMGVGAVPFATVLLALVAVQDPLLGGPDLAGLAPDRATLERVIAAFRPQLERRLRERHGLRMLAVYAYPAQVLFCRGPLGSLADLAGRRVRTSSLPQSDLVEALGARPVLTAFGELPARMRDGAFDCAITGTLSGNEIGLHEHTSHLHALPLAWGVAVFAANAAAWDALPAEVRQVLLRELPRLERAVLDDIERQTAQGVLCNTGAAGCRDGRPGRMTAIEAAADRDRLRHAFADTVLPRWLKRCGADCAAVWNGGVATALGWPPLAAAAR